MFTGYPSLYVKGCECRVLGVCVTLYTYTQLEPILIPPTRVMLVAWPAFC